MKILQPLALLLLVVWTAAAAQIINDLPERFTAFAVSPGGFRTNAVATQVELTINRWSTPEESRKLMAILKEKGPDQLLDALHDQKSVGTIRTPGNLAYDLRYAHKSRRATADEFFFPPIDLSPIGRR